jgi:hypothetical protein
MKRKERGVQGVGRTWHRGTRREDGEATAAARMWRAPSAAARRITVAIWEVERCEGGVWKTTRLREGGPHSVTHG